MLWDPNSLIYITFKTCIDSRLRTTAGLQLCSSHINPRGQGNTLMKGVFRFRVGLLLQIHHGQLKTNKP